MTSAIYRDLRIRRLKRKLFIVHEAAYGIVIGISLGAFFGLLAFGILENREMWKATIQAPTTVKAIVMGKYEAERACIFRLGKEFANTLCHGN